MATSQAISQRKNLRAEGVFLWVSGCAGKNSQGLSGAHWMGHLCAAWGTRQTHSDPVSSTVG